jgi:hypothetical protein
MRQLLVALVATAALFASQNSAQAVFVKFMIDDFEVPEGEADTSSDGDTEPLSPPNSDVATLRTLGPADQIGGLTVPTGGNGDRLNININSSNVWRIDYDLAMASMGFLQSAPLVIMTDVMGTGTMTVEMLVDGNPYDTAVFSGNGNLSFYNPLAALGSYSEISFLFSTETTFSGSADDIVANPEPATMALMGLGVLGGAIGYRRRRKDDAVAPVEA